MFRKFNFTDYVGNMEVKTVAYIGFPKAENEVEWKVQALLFTRVVGQNGNFRYVEINPTKEQAGKVISDLQADGATNWINALVYGDAIDTWLKESVVVDEDSTWIRPGKAFAIFQNKKREIGVKMEEGM